MTTERDYPPAREVAERPRPAQDSAYAHCLGCGRHVGGRNDAGFSSAGPAEQVEERARAHTVATGHPTRMYGGRKTVTEFYIAGDG